ncbi:hypothetical protein FQA39_LY16455 [Lamprigera yunnana]|nr:hypothetical protein FQA39_LY16455 [Lamprigera yunnana]
MSLKEALYYFEEIRSDEEEPVSLYFETPVVKDRTVGGEDDANDVGDHQNVTNELTISLNNQILADVLENQYLNLEKHSLEFFDI